jgi:integrase
MTLSGLFREARKSELVKENPVALVKKPKMENEIVRYLDPEEESRLLAFAPEPFRSAILVSIHSGLREGELAALTWNDVRFNEQSIVVRHSKNGSFRVIPMSKTLYRTLEAMPRHVASSYVFTNTNTSGPYGRFNNTVWRATLRRAGIKNFRWHDLRHTFGSRLAQAGEPLLAIRDLMGHKQIQVTMRYAHLAPSNLRTAVLALDRMGAAAAEMAASAPRSAPRPLEPRSAVI